jgi:hypothetical protein
MRHLLSLAAVVAACVVVAVTPAYAQQQALDPAAISITALDDVAWVVDAGGGSERFTLYGDPSQPGPYGFFIKWKAGNFSMPHFHPNDRHIVVVQGTWWVGTGADFDVDATVPLSPGTFVVHHAGEVHYDGARDVDAVMLIQGEGPGTSTPAVP